MALLGARLDLADIDVTSWQPCGKTAELAFTRVTTTTSNKCHTPGLPRKMVNSFGWRTAVQTLCETLEVTVQRRHW